MKDNSLKIIEMAWRVCEDLRFMFSTIRLHNAHGPSVEFIWPVGLLSCKRYEADGEWPLDTVQDERAFMELMRTEIAELRDRDEP